MLGRYNISRLGRRRTRSYYYCKPTVGFILKKIGNDPEVDWQWFQMILMTDVPWQLDWLEKCILRGVTIDKTWRALDTGHQVTIFDLVSTVEGGIRQETETFLSR